MNTQLSLFGNVLLSSILDELNGIWSQRRHYYPNQSSKYEMHKYHGGNLLFAIYNNKKDGESGEQIIARAVYFDKQNNGSYKVCHFDSDCLGGIVDKRESNLLLNAFVNQTEIVNDL